MRLHPILEDGRVRAVGIRELRDDAARVMREVCDGERTVITRHLAPCGVLFSMRDALELALTPFLARRALEVEYELQEGALVDPHPEQILPRRLLFTEGCADEYDALTPGRKNQVRGILRRAPSGSSTAWCPWDRWLVGYSLVRADTVVGFAFVNVENAIARLIGDDLRKARDGQDLRRSARRRDDGAPWRLSRPRSGA